MLRICICLRAFPGSVPESHYYRQPFSRLASMQQAGKVSYVDQDAAHEQSLYQSSGYARPQTGSNQSTNQSINRVRLLHADRQTVLSNSWLTIDKAIVDPQTHKVGAIPHGLLVAAAGGCLALCQLILVMWELKIPALPPASLGMRERTQARAMLMAVLLKFCASQLLAMHPSAGNTHPAGRLDPPAQLMLLLSSFASNFGSELVACPQPVIRDWSMLRHHPA